MDPSSVFQRDDKRNWDDKRGWANKRFKMMIKKHKKRVLKSTLLMGMG